MRLGDLQLRILRVLWLDSPATVACVQERLEGEALAYTTVATMLRKMEDRGLVEHTSQGRKFYYEAKVSEDQVTRSLSDDLLDGFFEGSLTSAVNHLLETRDVDPSELERLEQLIQQRKQQQ